MMMVESGQSHPRGRVVIGVLGMDQHEVGAVAVAQMLRDAGFEVIYLGRFNTPEQFAAVAAQEDADIVGVSCHSWEFLNYIDELVARCRDLGVAAVLGGSVLTERDAVTLRERGVAAVFTATATRDDIVAEMAKLVMQRADKSN